MSNFETDRQIFRDQGNGLFLPKEDVRHREDEYPSSAFRALLEMQAKHFWYAGRHRFILNILETYVRLMKADQNRTLTGIDLGGGCGGWVQFLQHRSPHTFKELALGDSSIQALEYAADVVGPAVPRYQIDLLDLPWENRWDVVFLLDVLEHIPEDVQAMKQVLKALRPGGIAIITTPALRQFWTYNDDLAKHVRRYSRREFSNLARDCGLELSLSRYFMFFLSPLLYLSRLKSPDIARMSPAEINAHLEQTHRVPSPAINGLLRSIFSMETPLGALIPFPWGTSILGVFRRPATLDQLQ